MTIMMMDRTLQLARTISEMSHWGKPEPEPPIYRA